MSCTDGSEFESHARVGTRLPNVGVCICLLCATLLRRFSDAIDDEPIIRDSMPLESDVDLKMEELSTRCVALANIFRSLSFIGNNEQVSG